MIFEVSEQKNGREIPRKKTSLKNYLPLLKKDLGKTHPTPAVGT